MTMPLVHEDLAEDAILARQDDVRQRIAADQAVIDAIKASRLYRLTQLARRVSGTRTPRRPVSVGTAQASDPPAATDPRAARLRDARAELARLEEDAFRVHDELHHLKLSRPRRLWLTARSRVAMLRHPVWSAGAIARAATSGGLGGALALAARRFRSRNLLLRFEPPVEQHTEGVSAAEAIRWLPPVRMSSQTRHALLMQPDSSIAFRLDLPAGGVIVADCGLLPSSWEDHRGGVTFDLDVELTNGGWRQQRSLHVDPRQRVVDRRWHPISVRLPPHVAGPAVVRLKTRVIGGAARVSAASVWGEPRVEWPTTRADKVQTLRAFGNRLRQAGPIGILRRLQGLQAADEHESRYWRWMALHTPTRDELAQMQTDSVRLAYRPRISIITPVYNTDPRWLRACIESVRAQVYRDWELCLADDGSTNAGTQKVLREYESDSRIRLVRLPANGGISVASNAALAQATGEFAALLDHDDELAPEALYEMVRVLNDAPETDLIYSDEDKLDALGERCDPYFKPDWSPEHFRSCMYTCHLMIARTSLVRSVGAFRQGFEGSQDYDLVLRLVEQTQRVRHVPKILYHWRKIPGSMAASGLAKTWALTAGERALQEHAARCGFDATVVPGPTPGLYRMRHRIVNRPLVSILIPTDGRSRELGGKTINLLVQCVRSIVQKSTYEHYEIVIADNGTLPEPTLAFLQSVPHRRVHFVRSGPFNYAAKINVGAAACRGDHLLLFNDDIEVIAPEWMEAMLEFSQQEDIGSVGAKLLYPDGRLQHIGVVMGVNGLAAHAFHGYPGSTVGYGSSAQIIRNYSALTTACMMTRRVVFERFKGFDERYVFDFNDTDYCLRLRRAGYRIVFTPYAELYHHEGATVGPRTWNTGDLDLMRREWADVIENDPYYNPHLTRDFADYRVRI